MGDMYLFFVDHETKRVHLQIHDRDKTSLVVAGDPNEPAQPYLRGDWSPTEISPAPTRDDPYQPYIPVNNIPSFLLSAWQGMEQELRMLEAWQEIEGELALDVQEETA